MPRFTVALLCLVLSLTSALAAPVERPEPGEVIDQVAKYTGLTNDAVSLALKDNAAAFGRLTDAVQALQIAQQFLDAKDADIAAMAFWSAADTAAEKLLPPPLTVAIKAMRVYKSILEELRDNVLIPALDQKIYEQYRAEREQNQDPVNAFDFAVTMVHGYYVVKPKMVEELIKAKGWNVDVMGERLRRLAETQVDRFWRERMEATFQQEKVKPQKEAILTQIWASVQDILDQLKAPAAPSDALFIDPTRDLPAGWWWVKGGIYDGRNWGPRDLAGMGGPARERSFVMSNGTGYSFYAQFSQFCRPWRNVTCDLPEVGVMAHITRWPDEKTAIEYMAPSAPWAPLGGSAWVLRPRPGLIALNFAFGPYEIHISAEGENAAQVHLPTLQRFARMMMERIRAENPSLKSPMPF